MGLLNYYSPHAGQGGIQGLQGFRQIFRPVRSFHPSCIFNLTFRGGGECWEGCDWLGDNLESKFTLPGTHGEMYPWDPPTVGVSELVLKKLHEELWNRLHKVVLKSVVRLYSRHSSPSGALEEFYVPPESEAGQRIPQTVADTPSGTANDDGGPWETVLSKQKQKQQGKSSGTIVTRRG